MNYIYALNCSKHTFLLCLTSLFFLMPTVIYSQSGLANLMKIEEAQRIARQSVQRASGTRIKRETFTGKTYGELLDSKYLRNCLTFKEKEDFQKDFQIKLSPDKEREFENRFNGRCFPEKRLKMSDSIKFLGITDEFRLATLRRYIVRNTEIGVPSIWGFGNNSVAQPYIVTNAQLYGITLNSTVMDIAMMIQKSAGLPSLSFAAVKTVVSDCRHFTTAKSDELKVDSLVKSDIGDDVNITKFLECLEKPDDVKNSKIKYGIGSIKLNNGAGDSYYFSLLPDDKAALKKISDTGNYLKLIDDLKLRAKIVPDSETIAVKFVVNSLLSILSPVIKAEECKSVRPSTVLLGLAKKQASVCVAVAGENTAKVDNTTLEMLGITDAMTVKNKFVELSAPTEVNNYHYVEKNKFSRDVVLKKIPQFKIADFSFDKNTTIDRLIEIINLKL